MSSLKELEACGQSAWLDFLDHSFIESGKLHKLVERDGLKGVTSNPSILEKAIGETRNCWRKAILASRKFTSA